MNDNTVKQTGWKPIPLSLKILFVLFMLWVIGSVLNFPNLYESGLPLLGEFVYGLAASSVVLLLDIVGPTTFLFALWARKSWGPAWAFSYISLFIINGVFALLTISEQWGLLPFLIPILASVIFLIVIYRSRSYFI